MAFYPWLDTLEVGKNCQSASTFGGDSQRQNGFTAGDVASSIRVNTALRQANLIACALMSAIGDSTHSVESTVSDIAQSIREHVALDLPYYSVNQNFSIYTPLEMDSIASRGCFSVNNNESARNKVQATSGTGHSNVFFFGEGLESFSSNQFLIGTFNDTAAIDDILIVGCGSPTERKNALRLNSNGGLWIGGNLTLGGFSGNAVTFRPDFFNFVLALSENSQTTATTSATLSKGLYSFTITATVEVGVTENYNLLFDTGDDVSYSTRFKVRGKTQEYCLKSTPSDSSQDNCTITIVDADSHAQQTGNWGISYKLAGWTKDFNLA